MQGTVGVMLTVSFINMCNAFPMFLPLLLRQTAWLLECYMPEDDWEAGGEDGGRDGTDEVQKCGWAVAGRTDTRGDVLRHECMKLIWPSEEHIRACVLTENGVKSQLEGAAEQCDTNILTAFRIWVD